MAHLASVWRAPCPPHRGPLPKSWADLWRWHPPSAAGTLRARTCGPHTCRTSPYTPPCSPSTWIQLVNRFNGDCQMLNIEPFECWMFNHLDVDSQMLNHLNVDSHLNVDNWIIWVSTIDRRMEDGGQSFEEHSMTINSWRIKTSNEGHSSEERETNHITQFRREQNMNHLIQKVFNSCVYAAEIFKPSLKSAKFSRWIYASVTAQSSQVRLTSWFQTLKSRIRRVWHIVSYLTGRCKVLENQNLSTFLWLLSSFEVWFREFWRFRVLGV